jgi:uncharacterized protein YndB with AHSA1/START domain
MSISIGAQADAGRAEKGADMTDIAIAPTDGSVEADYEAWVGFASPPEAVFEALTTLQGLAGWWSRVTGDGHAGGQLSFVFGDDVPAVMHVDAAQPGSLVQWTCVGYAPLPDWAGTTISFELTPRSAGGCDLSFRHAGLTPRLECYNDCKNGWDHFLPSLRDYVDTGEGNPWASSADVVRREARRLRRLSSAAV